MDKHSEVGRVVGVESPKALNDVASLGGIGWIPTVWKLGVQVGRHVGCRMAKKQTLFGVWMPFALVELLGGRGKMAALSARLRLPG